MLAGPDRCRADLLSTLRECGDELRGRLGCAQRREDPDLHARPVPAVAVGAVSGGTVGSALRDGVIVEAELGEDVIGVSADRPAGFTTRVAARLNLRAAR